VSRALLISLIILYPLRLVRRGRRPGRAGRPDQGAPGHRLCLVLLALLQERELWEGEESFARVSTNPPAGCARDPHLVPFFSLSLTPFFPHTQARELLDSLGARYHVVELDRVPRGFALKKELSKLTGRSSVPSVFVKGRHLGGCYDGPGVVPLYRTGELQKVLKAARAL
jgi:glutaredoxin 3